MTSRLSAYAALFAVLSTASLAFAATLHSDVTQAQAASARTQIVQLERVVITAKRLPVER